MEAIIEEMNSRINRTSPIRSNLGVINGEIERYWKHILETTEDFFELDTTDDHDELAVDIWDILFENNEDYQFDYDYYMEVQIYTSLEPLLEDIPLMCNYFNNYFEETYGGPDVKDLTMNKIFINYAHAYAGYNNIQEKIKQWLDENLISDTDTETTEIPLWDGGEEEGEILEE